MEIKETLLDSVRSRPRFKIYSNLSREKYTQLLKDFLTEKNHSYTGNINSETALIRVKNNNTQFWKPCLALRTETEGNKTVLRGVFGPTSAVWTFFMFLYFILAICWMVCITLWYVEKQIKSSDFPWALTGSFIVLFLLAITYAASQVGKIRAKSEMQKLRDFAEESLRTFEKNQAAGFSEVSDEAS